MSDAGYGNHDTGLPGAAVANPVVGAKPDPDKAGAGAQPEADDDRRAVATPGDGAGPAGPQGAEVDPGTG